jgi:SAM-dependent methyltransferase
MPKDEISSPDGWPESAAAWIADMGERGDFGREFVLDPRMAARVQGRGFHQALDVGCGEGRFCRMMRGWGVTPIGIDPTEALVEEARRREPDGDYRIGRGEALDFADGRFDLVVSYLSLIDISDAAAAIAEMARVLRPGGTLLIANLNGFSTAGAWVRDGKAAVHFAFDRYLEARPEWVGWRGIRIQNWHRPLSDYMTALLGQGLILRHFDEPAPLGGEPGKADRYRRAPWFHIMEWEKPPAPGLRTRSAP